MQVQTGDRWNLKNGTRENLSIRHHHDHLRRQGAYFGHGLLVFDASRLQYRHFAVSKRRLDGRRFDPLGAPHRLVRLSHDADQFMFFRFEQ
jgi:hypothetical protein